MNYFLRKLVNFNREFLLKLAFLEEENMTGIE